MDIITATAIMMATMNGFSASEQMVYNPIIEGNVVTSIEVMEKQEDSNMLTFKLKNLFTYDDEERLVKKEVLRWNSTEKKWQKSHCWNYSYGLDRYTLEFACWNSEEGAYTKNQKKQEMDEGIDGTLVVTQYIRSDADEVWQLTESYLMLRPDDVLMAAAF